ncbi:MAG: DUF2087 domain-containing protein [Acidimicrobiales bacterium]
MATDEPTEPGPLNRRPFDARALVGLLAEPDRLRVVAALILRAATVDELRAATGLDARAVGRALTRLVDTGLVVRDDRRHWLLEDAFRHAAMAAVSDSKDARFDAPDDAARVLRAFVREGRLVSIPAQRSKRRVILDVIVQEFEPGRRYTEGQVNAVLAAWHDDVAALRRYLVDEEFLEREDGGRAYWRAGGSFDV